MLKSTLSAAALCATLAACAEGPLSPVTHDTDAETLQHAAVEDALVRVASTLQVAGAHQLRGALSRYLHASSATAYDARRDVLDALRMVAAEGDDAVDAELDAIRLSLSAH
jgi:uncharacterized protein YpuA (DUF1002 family)